MNAPATVPAPDLSTLPVRFSHLKAYGRSAAHGLHARLVEMEPTYAMERGTAVHALLFNTRKVVGWTGAVRRGKEYEAFERDHADCEILTGSEYEKARLMAESVRRSPLAMAALDGEQEKTIRFDWYGMKCRATPDVRGDGFLTELKTSASSDPSRFVWHALRMQYNAQLRLQQIACGHDIDDSITRIVAVESAPPFPVTVFRVEPRALEIGERSLVAWMERLKTCEASQNWPPYVECEVPLDIPEDVELEYGDEDGN